MKKQENENLKRAQIELSKLLVEFKKICEKENLTYYLIGGTLLGAVRHRGFIPWDDDIDVGMPREDYQKFIKVAPKYLPNGLEVLHYSLDPEYQDYTMKVINNNVAYITKQTNLLVEKKLWIDIFPIDGSPKTNLHKWFHYRKIDFHRMLIAFHYIKYVRIDPNRNICKRLLVKFAQIIPIGKLIDPNKQKSSIDKELMKYSPKNSETIGTLMGAYHSKEMVNKKLFGKGSTVSFEGVSYHAPASVDLYLRHI